MIAIRNLRKSYGGKTVLKGIDLSFEPGFVYGIVGQNGAGKTTLFKAVAGLEEFEGAIESSHELLKNHVGFLETNPIFLSRMTGWEYLKLLCAARNIKEDNFEEENLFDLPLDEYAENYSTGMKKKLALMGTILQRNELFILDEPFNGVDIYSNLIITKIVRKLKAANKTVLISSHIFSTLSDTCDIIHLIEEGKVVKSVDRDGFADLDQEMRSFDIGEKLDRLSIF